MNIAVVFFAALLSACSRGDRTADSSTARDSVATGTIAISVPDPRLADTGRAIPGPAASPVTPVAPAPARAPVRAPDTTSAKQSASDALAAQDVDREIARAVAAWRNVRTLRATFQQTVTNPLTGSEVGSRGELQQQKPAKLAITFVDPMGDRIISDGQFVWVYLQSATPGQVVKMRVTDIGAASTDLIGQFLNTPRDKYDASDAGQDRVGDRPARALVLTAKPGQSLPFIRAKVWVDARDALIRQFEAVDANGISRKVRILAMSPNAAVDQSAFRFDVPAGVRVIER